MKNNGFTIIEIALVMAIFSSVLVTITSVMVYFFKSYSFSFEEFQSISIAQSTLTRLMRDIREIQIGENGAWPLVATDDNSMTFYSDVNGDNETDRIRYFLDGTDFKKGIIEPSGNPVLYPPASETISIVASHITNTGTPIFRYYNSNWPSDQINNPLAPANRITNTRLVSVYLKIDTQTTTQTGGFEMTKNVEIRSMKDNP